MKPGDLLRVDRSYHHAPDYGVARSSIEHRLLGSTIPNDTYVLVEFEQGEILPIDTDRLTVVSIK